MQLLRRVLTILLLWAAASPASANFHLWTMSELYSSADGTVQFLEFTTGSGGQEFLGGHSLQSQSGGTTHTFNFPANLPGDSANRKFLVGTTAFAALGVVTPDYVVPNGFFFPGGGTVSVPGMDTWVHGALPAPNLSLNRVGSTAVNSPQNFAGQSGSVSSPPPPPLGGSSAKTLGSRATVTPAVTLFGGFELASDSTVYILVRGNSLGTLGVTQNFLDSPRVRLFNSAGQDLLSDGGTAGFTGCSSTANSGAAVVNYYANVRGQPANARDGCTAQTLAAGVYTFTVTPSTTGNVSAPSSGEVLFEVTLGSGAGSITKTLGSRATVSPTVTLFGGFELPTAATVYVLVRGNSLGTLGVTQSFLDSPRVRLFNGQGVDLINDGGVAGFTGCSSTANSGAAVVNYYTSVRGQPAHARDGCTAQSLAAGVYTFTVTPSTTGSISNPATGEVLFEVTLSSP